MVHEGSKLFFTSTIISVSCCGWSEIKFISIFIDNLFFWANYGTSLLSENIFNSWVTKRLLSITFEVATVKSSGSRTVKSAAPVLSILKHDKLQNKLNDEIKFEFNDEWFWWTYRSSEITQLIFFDPIFLQARNKASLFFESRLDVAQNFTVQQILLHWFIFLSLKTLKTWKNVIKYISYSRNDSISSFGLGFLPLEFYESVKRHFIC